MDRQQAMKLYGKSRRRPRMTPEATLQMHVMEYMRLLPEDGCIALSIPNERKCSEAMGTMLNRMGRMSGAADLLILRRGQVPAFLELKAKGETQSFAQMEFQMLCRDMGFPYAVADDIGDALAILRQWGALKPDVSFRRKAA